MKKHNLRAVVLFTFVLAAFFVISEFAFASGNQNNLADRVTRNISTRYDWGDQPAPHANVQVTENGDGWIQLTGNVKSLFEKYRIYRIASRVSGVKKITNDIKVEAVQTPGMVNPEMQTPASIKEQIRTLIDRSAVISQPNNIKIAVDNSDNNIDVEFTGNVNYYREKIFATTIASQVPGVTAVDNNITVEPIGKALDDNSIQTVLVSILKDEFPTVNPANVNIQVKNGFVTVTGKVGSLWVKDNIRDEFASVLGVKDVIDKLAVNPDLSS